MLLVKKEIISLLFLVLVTTCFSQEKKDVELLPKSIYTTVPETPNFNCNYFINKKLNLTSYKFIVINTRAIEDGYFNIPLYKTNNLPSEYIYDTYNKIYHNLQLQKSFFKVSDLYKVRPKNSL